MEDQITRLLLEKAYVKVREEMIKESGINPTNHTMDIWLSEYLRDEQHIPYSYKSLENRRREFDSNESIRLRQPKVIDGLASFLGYENYAAFYEGNKLGISMSKTVIKNKRKRWKWTLSILITVNFLVVLMVYAAMNNNFCNSFWGSNAGNKCMVWVNNQYQQTPCDLEKIESGEVISYDEDHLKNFKRKHPDSIQAFFNSKGDPVIWYGKNAKGEYEYYTALGFHPKTGKSLKPISHYIINKYILPAQINHKDSIH